MKALGTLVAVALVLALNVITWLAPIVISVWLLKAMEIL